MGLQRKENHLRKAQAKFEKASRRSKQFQIEFVRQQKTNGRFRTRANIVRREKNFHGNNCGLLHKAVNSKYRIYGDKPSFTRFVNSFQPKTAKGKLLKNSVRTANFIVHDVGQTAVDTALAGETIGLKSAEIAQREIKNKAVQKYTREAVDDYHRGMIFMGRTAVDAVRGTQNHLKSKKRHKLEKAKFRLKRAEYAVFRDKNFKPEIKKINSELKKEKRKFRRKVRNVSDRRTIKAEKQNFRITKNELKFKRKQLKKDSKFRKKNIRNQRKIAKNSKSGLLIFKPVKYTAGRMKASAWQKAVNEDQENDFVHAIDSAKRRIAEPVAQKVAKTQRLQRAEKKRDRLNDSESKSKNRLKIEENRLNKKREKFNKKPKVKVKKSLSENLKSAFNFVKNVFEKEAKAFFASAVVPIILIFLVFAFIIMIFSSVISGGGFTLGTYASQDYDLSEAEKYYTKLAYDFNEKIRKVGDSSDWKDGLADFGADKSNLKDKPDNWYFGRSAVYDWEPVYDFDCYKLWSFLCAYYYDFSAKNGDIKYWDFGGNTEELLDEIFDAEYEFVYWYDNTSGWEYRHQFESYGYYSINGSGTTGSYGYVDISHPDALPFDGFNDGNTIYFDLSNGEILNYNDDYSATGWYLKNQYYDDYDPNGNCYEGWYQDGETCSYGIYENDVLVTPIPYVIPSESWCSFLKKYDWVTDCRLYYNVKQKKTFDEVITEKLSDTENANERVEYYNLLAGNDTATMCGNHQTLRNMLSESSIRNYNLKREFGYEMTDWNSESDGLYQGIKVYCNNGEPLFAPFDCEIKEVDTDSKKIILRKDDVQYWYDGTGGTKRDTEVEITNCELISDYEKGDKIKLGDEFAKTTSENVNFHINVDTDGVGWDYIDPRLVLY